MEPTPDLNRETPESLANRLSINWFLETDLTPHNNRMTRLSKNLNNLFINQDRGVYGTINNTNILLGDNQIPDLFHKLPILFKCYKPKPKGQIVIKFYQSTNLVNINHYFNTTFSEEEAGEFIEIISRHVIKEIEDKMKEPQNGQKTDYDYRRGNQE